jgi:hypothetical protein
MQSVFLSVLVQNRKPLILFANRGFWKRLKSLNNINLRGQMKQLTIFSLILTIIIAVAAIVIYEPFSISSSPAKPPVYVGVSYCGNTTQQAELLIDKVKAYTNLFVLQSGPISLNETATTEICDYATSQGLNIIVYFGWFNPSYPWQFPWVQNATKRYGDKFLGVYYYDEPGGIQLDYDWAQYFANITRRYSNPNASRNFTGRYRNLIDSIKGYLNGTTKRDYNVAADVFVQYMKRDINMTRLENISMPTFVSDYALYWWDYVGGYNVVLSQFGSNNTVKQEIALIRGAARMQNTQWGAIITWKYDTPPYLDTGPEIYTQMRMAYDAGAKYIILFDYPQIGNNPYGVLTEEHFKALQDFWSNIKTYPTQTSEEAEAVLVLPKNYGWGMRHPEDRIWLWGPDELSPQIWNVSRVLLDKYGLRLDIVYDDSAFPVAGKYEKIYYWNETIQY